LALLDYEGSTLLGINRLLADKKFRSKVLRKLTDPVIKSFWTNEFANYEPRYQKEAVAPIQNKIGQFLSASVIRNMVAQVKSTIDVREIMDNKKILIMNLSKGRIGEDNSRLLGGMLITEIQLAAMSRVDMPEEERKDFFLYVDEFQNFATPSFANILSEARKYRLSLIMAHQYVMQLDEVVADAVFGNVGSMVTFRVGAGDAETLEKEYAPTFTIEDIVNLPKFQIFLKLMIDGIASQPFSALTMPPIGSRTGSAEKVIRVSRERYGKSREVIEDKITRWSGMEVDDDDDDSDSGSNGNGGSRNNKPKSGGNSGGSNGSNQRPKSSNHESKKSEPRKEEKKREEKPRQEPKREHSSAGASSNLADKQDKKEEEPVLHLSDLMPAKEAPSTDVQDKKEENATNAKPSVSAEEQERKKIDERFGQEKKSDNPVASMTSSDSPQPNGEKKKRKRKRKRKKKKNENKIEDETKIETKIEDFGQQITNEEQKKFQTTEQSELPARPKKMNEDEVVTFNNDDDDDSWRWDR